MNQIAANLGIPLMGPDPSVFRQAEAKNRYNLVQGLTDRSSEGIPDAASNIMSMRDGEASFLGEFGTHTPMNGKEFKEEGEYSMALSLGKVDLRSTARFYGRRSGDNVKIIGIVRQNLRDRYDFHPEVGSLSRAAHAEMQAGRAAEFDHVA